jgi:hypothetical protein
MAGRLRLARVQGVGGERLRRMAAKGLTMDDPFWLCTCRDRTACKEGRAPRAP